MFIKTATRTLAGIGITLLIGCGDSNASARQSASDAEQAPDEQQIAEAIAAAKAIITEEHLITEIPESWLKIRDSKVANLHVAEYVPPDTVDVWSEKLSIEAMQGDDLPDPLEFLDGVAADQAALCEGFSDSPIYAGYENGYETVVKLLQCRASTRTGKPIVSMLKAIRGNKSLYTISRFWRLPEPVAEDEDLAIDPQAIAAWSNVLSDTYVCDKRTEEHPCR